MYSKFPVFSDTKPITFSLFLLALKVPPLPKIDEITQSFPHNLNFLISDANAVINKKSDKRFSLLTS